ncbi:uncharacterized protein LOC112346226 [Selaginella moellendorffii]|uniref:uncharacterized protein LOC112346226 n=1 Tax=Selaginella moellendorffii TaxID=88036 RepID=UPI000D1CEA9E|nr:uncharacterized protein LOC112346226 [Selaginella moellendorffii]|eukprot:XP_024530381.1 uncharacterized protein LOC112346226 [Selaginella moellendorffii]
MVDRCRKHKYLGALRHEAREHQRQASQHKRCSAKSSCGNTGDSAVPRLRLLRWPRSNSYHPGLVQSLFRAFIPHEPSARNQRKWRSLRGRVWRSDPIRCNWDRSIERRSTRRWSQ